MGRRCSESDSKTNSFDKMQSRVQYTSGLSCDTRLRSRKNRDLSDGGKAGRSYLGPAETYHGRQEEK